MEVPVQTQAHRTLRFGVFEVSLRTAELRKHGVRIRLEEQPFHILSLLLESPGELVTREELRRSLWAADTFVDFDRSLNKAMSKLRLALGDSSESPRFIETLHRRGYRFIAPVQIEEPAKHEPAHDSDPNLNAPLLNASPAPVAAPASVQNERWRISWKLLSAALLIVFGFFSVIYFRGHVAVPAASTITPRRSVAVLGFRNLSGRTDQAWISTALSDWLTTELSAGEQLRTVPEEIVARTRIELSLPDVDSLGKDTLGRIAKNLNADFVVVGSYAVLDQAAGGQVRLDLRLQNTHDGETVGAVSETGAEARLFDLVSEAGQQLRVKLGVQAVTRREAAELAVALPSNHDGARLYSEGLAKLRVFDALAARETLQKAIALEPDYAPAHSALAMAWAELGFDENAKSEAKRAYELSPNLPRADRLLVEGRYQEMSKNWEKAIETYRALFAFFPDSLDYGLALAQAQVRAGRGKEALETIEALQKLPSPLRDDPRIDLAESRAAESLSDYKRDDAACIRAAEKARTAGASLLLAEARGRDAWALLHLGQSDASMRAAEESKQIYQSANYRRGVASAINAIGIALEDKGDSAGAKAMYEEALVTFEQIGNKLGVANELDDLGDVLLALGDLKGARQKYEASMAADEEIQNPDGIALAKGALGVVLLATGDHEGAKKNDQESIDLCRRIGDREKAGIGLAGLGNVFRVEGDLAQARKYESESVAIFDQVGDKRSATRFKLDLARIAIDEGNAAQAETIASSLAAELVRENAPRDEALANVILSRALLAEEKNREAQAAINRSLSLADKYRDKHVELLATMTAAQIAVTNNAAAKPDSLNRLQQVSAEATRSGFVIDSLEARLILGEIEIRSGNRAAGLSQLASVRNTAADRGIGSIAQKATAAMKQAQ